MKCKECGSEEMEIVADFDGPECHYVRCGGCKRKGPAGKNMVEAHEKWVEDNK